MPTQEVTDAYAAAMADPAAGSAGYPIDLPDGSYKFITGKAYTGQEQRLQDGNDGVFVMDRPGTQGITTIASTDTVPTAARTVAGTPGDTLVHLTWLAPTSDGGETITGYKVYKYIAGVVQGSAQVVATAVLLVDVTGLTNDTAYTFKVSAVNAEGEGPQSTASAAITPAAA
jgi:hypothetical protein